MQIEPLDAEEKEFLAESFASFFMLATGCLVGRRIVRHEATLTPQDADVFIEALADLVIDLAVQNLQKEQNVRASNQ